MGARRADAETRRFFDEFAHVRVSRFRAMGVIDPAKREAVIPFPDGSTKLIGVKHTRFPNGGGWSWFVCPKCARRAAMLYLVHDAPLCTRCCDALNIKHTGRYGFGRETRRRAKDKKLDEIIAKLETKEPLRLKPAPASWQGKARKVYHSHRLQEAMRRRLIELRLDQLASQQASEGHKDDDTLKGYMPSEPTRQLIDISSIWRANTTETLQQALDAAQVTILKALESDEPEQRIAAAKLLLNTKQARERGM